MQQMLFIEEQRKQQDYRASKQNSYKISIYMGISY